MHRHLFAGFMFTVLALLLIPNFSLNADAQSIRLSVSAKDTGGKFFGPQIVQVVVEGSSIRNPDTSIGSLVVNGQTLPLVHLSNGSWYAFFADSTFATLAGATGIPGSSEGNFWVVGPNGKNALFPTLPSALNHDGTSSINPDLDLDGDCPAAINAQDSCVEWPYIRLFNFNKNDQVSIRYSGQSVTLNYVEPTSSDITLSLDRDFYPIDAEIIFGLSDYMWNINPVEEDRATFAFGNGNSEVFYQASPSLPAASITSIMPNLGFDSNQILSLQGKDGIRFENTISGMPATVMIEKFPNAGMFENFDTRADMFAKERNVQFRFDYFNKSIAAGMGRSDASVSVGKEEPKVGTKTPEVKEEVKVDPYSISEPRVVSLLGKPVSSIAVEQPVLIQTTLTNNLDEEQLFTYIVQVKDEDEFTAMLTWIKGNINAKRTFNPGISWTPESEGDYTIEIFVWKSIDEPGTSPLTKSLKVSVS